MKIAFMMRALRSDGIASYVIRLAELVPEDCVLIVGKILIEDEALRERAFNAFGEVAELPELSSKSALGSVVRLHSTFRRLKVDVAHVHEMHLLKVVSPAARLIGVPIVATSHLQSSGGAGFLELSKRAFALGLAAVLGDRYIAISAEMEDEFRQVYRIPESRTERVVSGVNIRHFRPPTPEERSAARSKVGLDSGGDDVVFLQIARLTEVKAPDVTLSAFAALRERTSRSVRLLYAGRGPLRDPLQARVAELDLGDSVKFLGFRPPREVMWASDVLCLPSRAEGFSLVCAEAMACGLPVLRSMTAGFVDQLGGLAGVPYMDPQDETGNIEALHMMLEDETRERLGDVCLRRARERLDEALMASKMSQIYQSLGVAV